MKMKPLLLFFLMISCNSNEKKVNEIDYSKKRPETKINKELKASMSLGKITYKNMCITCHMPNGKGIPKAFPPLANSDYLKENQTESIKGIKNGMSGEMTVNGITYNSIMSPLNLSDKEVADVMNFINNNWGNNYGKMITAQEVTNIIKK